jgi:DNA replication protein DnaC
MITQDKCWYKGVCNLDKECSSSCIRFLEMRHLMENSNIPESRWFPDTLTPDDCDYDAFCKLADIKSHIVEFVNNGENLYLYSDRTGNGKTSWSIKLMLKYFDSIWAGNGFKSRGIFVHTPTLLTKLKDFDNKDSTIVQLKNLIPEVDLVIWDDVASTVLSNYDHSQLITLIDQRILNRKSNIFTGNLKQAGIEKSLGARLASRVWNASTRIELKGRDKR